MTLGYLGRGLQGVIVLPNAGQTTDASAARHTPDHFARRANLTDTGRRSVTLSLPKFKREGGTMDFTAALPKLGLRRVFDRPPGTANFDGIAPRRPTTTSRSPKSSPRPSSPSTKAAPSLTPRPPWSSCETPASRSPPAVPVTVVRVDRPFLFALQHRARGACLFLRRVTDLP